MRRTGTPETLYKIKDKATEMHDVFRQFAARDLLKESPEEDFTKLGTILESIKRLNIELERTVSNDHLDALFAAISSFVSGSNIIGAGSGGFILGWLKEGCTKQQVAEALKTKFPEAELTEMTICTDFVM